MYVSQVIAVAFGLSQALPFSTYGESVFMVMQCMLTSSIESFDVCSGDHCVSHLQVHTNSTEISISYSSSVVCHTLRLSSERRRTSAHHGFAVLQHDRLDGHFTLVANLDQFQGLLSFSARPD